MKYETKGCSEIPRLHFNFFCSTFHKFIFQDSLNLQHTKHIFKFTYYVKDEVEEKSMISSGNGNEPYFKKIPIFSIFPTSIVKNFLISTL